MFQILTIGDVLVDTHVMIDDAANECRLDESKRHLCLDFASKIPVTGSFQAIGGNAANVAVGISKLALNSGIISAVGKDGNGRLITTELKKNKVNTNLIAKENIPTRYAIVLNYHGERTVLSYHAKRRYAWPKNIPATDWVYYTSLSAGFDGLQDNLEKFLDKHPTVRLAVNPGSFQLKYGLEKIKEIIKRADLLILNREEAEKILGTTFEKEKNISTLIHELLGLGAKEVALTDGAKGAWAGNQDNIWFMESFPVEVKAKTGAGDAFSSGYVGAKIFGHDTETSLKWGIANSCGVIQKTGAQTGLLDEKGIRKMLATYSSIVPKKS